MQDWGQPHEGGWGGSECRKTKHDWSSEAGTSMKVLLVRAYWTSQKSHHPGSAAFSGNSWLPGQRRWTCMVFLCSPKNPSDISVYVLATDCSVIQVPDCVLQLPSFPLICSWLPTSDYADRALLTQCVLWDHTKPYSNLNSPHPRSVQLLLPSQAQYTSHSHSCPNCCPPVLRHPTMSTTHSSTSFSWHRLLWFYV